MAYERLQQEFGGREHSPSGATFSTDVHGKVAEAISISEMGDVTEVKPVHVLGSVHPVAFGQPSGELAVLDLKMRLSGLKPFEAALRSAFAVPVGIPISSAGAQMVCTITNEALDGNEDVLPTVSRTFAVIYLGSTHGFDRSSNDPQTAVCKLQLIEPAQVKA